LEDELLIFDFFSSPCYHIFGNFGELFMDIRFLFAALAIMLIIIVRDFLKKRYGFDMDKIDVSKWRTMLKKSDNFVITRTTGNKALVMLDAGVNKATVMATLRQITGIDYNSAKQVVEHLPSEFMVNISEKEADLTKKALEFVGATVEIK
jgi:ribosomal protein L7/L12